MDKTQEKKKLRIINNPVIGTTCFSEHIKHNVSCNKKSCPNWIDFDSEHNCVLIAAQQGAHTLQTIGKLYSLSRMRICQIEKEILKKIRSQS